MEQFFLIILIFLALLAAFDLFVGVSNDAVNFLNSAIGSRIAPFKVIMLIASLGVLIGATFSSGMMEIARSGVFNPEMFSFIEIMVIFFAVMVTDVLLLDIFNSFGLPTSTTVSIVFELLGGSVAAAAYKIYTAPEGANLGVIGDYINNEKALAIISAILISVAVAFTAGAIIQFITRLIFSFKFERIYKYAGSAFGGIAITAIIYFLVMKGAKGSSFMKPEYVDWINHHTFSILLYLFLSITVLFQILITFFKTNIFRIVILMGTFALAFAFAGNDLVNFIGVPLAARDSYRLFAESGASPDLFMMGSLKEAVKTPTLFLLLAGTIMVLTLIFSKKAHRVVQTSINLSSGSRGAKEQFGSSLLGRSIVRTGLKFGKLMHQVLPQSALNTIDRRFEKPVHKKGEIVLPFDHVRASINLVVSSILIASATSLKLPLSTTYVTFMVAMGSSLADGAWDRESAVYRVSGVLTVIGGWFFTAFSAFTLCALITLLILWGGNYATVGLLLLVIGLLIRSNFFNKKKGEDELVSQMDNADKVFICNSVNTSVSKYFDDALEIYASSMTHFFQEDLKGLRKDRSAATVMHEEIAKRRSEYYSLALNGGEDKVDRDARHYYYRVFTNIKEVSHGLRSIVGTNFNHVDNNHTIFKGVLRQNIEQMLQDLFELKASLLKYVNAPTNDDDHISHLVAESIAKINVYQRELLLRIDEENLSLRSSELYLNILQYSRDVINRFSLVALLQHELNDKVLSSNTEKEAQ